MSKRSLGVVAVILILLMAVVAIAGLDSLPRTLKGRAQAVIAELASDRAQFDRSRASITAALAADPDLFRNQSIAWRGKLDSASAALAAATAEEKKIQSLLEANRREDLPTMEAALGLVGDKRKAATQTASTILADVKRWQEYKQKGPEILSEVRTRAASVKGFNIETSAAPARKASIDWPAKKSDFDTRFAALADVQTRAVTAAASAEGTLERNDYATLITTLEALKTAENELKSGVETANALAAQLYVGRDKVLLDLDEDEGKRQRVKVVETRYNDATLKDPKVSEAERWEPINDARFRELAKAVNMVVERKAPGKFDSESEKTAQAPGYAYIAPPGQANQYGSWSNGVWSWLPQYLIMSQLLRGNSYPPVRYDDYNSYNRDRRSGGEWYSRHGGRTWSGGSGGATGGGIGGALRRSMEKYSGDSGSRAGSSSEGRRRETWSWGGNSSKSGGGYSGSKYQSRGSYGGSRYSSRPSSGGFGSRSYSRGFGGRSFGGGRRR